MKLATSLHKIGFALTTAGTLILPFFFLPLTSEFYDFNKQALVIFLALASLLILTASFVAERQVTLTFSLWFTHLGLPYLSDALHRPEIPKPPGCYRRSRTSRYLHRISRHLLLRYQFYSYQKSTRCFSSSSLSLLASWV